MGNDEGSIWQAVLGLLWPPAAPTEQRRHVWWRLICIASVIPVTAVFHNALFYRPTCMLNNFGSEYSPSVVVLWLSRDPSLPWAIVMMLSIYGLGLERGWLRRLAAPLFIAFLPLSLWVWDIPFTGRAICGYLHDARAQIGGIPLRGRYFYLVGLLIYLSFLGIGWLRRGRGGPGLSNQDAPD